ncbi:MAG TPA: hypothetical protein DCZ23_00865 [Lachnospiraceae bacterium]|nr:hypothetical protein [Lachnospiraceae bacterium]
MSQFLMKPRIDFAFKEIMANENVRTGFLSAVLKIKPEDIKETQILNTFLRKEYEEDKQGILDVRILMNNDTEIDTEIQLSELKVWADRSLFYISKMYTEQIHEGQKYDIFKKCVSISILDFKLFKDTKDYYSCFHIREDKRNTILTDKMEFHVLELPKLPKELKENSDDLLLWAKFINSEQKEEFEMLAEKNQYIDSAYKQLQVISQDKQKRLEYEAREKAIRDHNQMMFEATENGIEIGEMQKSIAITKKLINFGMSFDNISQITGLKIKDIEKIRAENQLPT